MDGAKNAAPASLFGKVQPSVIIAFTVAVYLAVEHLFKWPRTGTTAYEE